MKKKMTLCIVLMLLCGTLVSCKGSSSVVGTTWIAKSANIGGTEYTQKDLKETYGEYTYAFKKGDKVDITMLDQVFQGTYTQKGNEVVIKIMDQKFTGKVKGDTMKIDYQEVNFVFEKVSK